MKKLFCCLMVFALLLGTAACGATGGGNTQPAATSGTQAATTEALFLRNLSHASLK